MARISEIDDVPTQLANTEAKQPRPSSSKKGSRVKGTKVDKRSKQASEQQTQAKSLVASKPIVNNANAQESSNLVRAKLSQVRYSKLDKRSKQASEQQTQEKSLVASKPVVNNTNAQESSNLVRPKLSQVRYSNLAWNAQMDANSSCQSLAISDRQEKSPVASKPVVNNANVQESSNLVRAELP